jgi:acyl-CoA reductase-like NAD-dependent aldehyde dehydrogenase
VSAAVSDAPAIGAAIESRDIATDDVIETFPSMRAQDVAALIAVARRVTPVWHRIGFARRRMHLLAWAADIVAHRDNFVALIERECGKPRDGSRRTRGVRGDDLPITRASGSGGAAKRSTRRPSVRLKAVG